LAVALARVLTGGPAASLNRTSADEQQRSRPTPGRNSRRALSAFAGDGARLAAKAAIDLAGALAVFSDGLDTLFGTFGAFIRIRSPITTRRALFDVGVAGPIVGFLIAAPAMAFAVASSKIVAGVENGADILFGDPPLVRILKAVFHPHVDPSWILLQPIGRAAWIGMFATALNLLPCWQLDGGHILFSLEPTKHRQASLAVALTLVGLGIYAWHGWLIWGFILTILCLRYRHPPFYDPWESLDAKRKLIAAAAVIIFLLCFTPWPATNP
jgi:membrane-associated protease RseP (regulator of RpoE activity)